MKDPKAAPKEKETPPCEKQGGAEGEGKKTPEEEGVDSAHDVMKEFLKKTKS